jgi:hypothetical protein
MSSWANPGSAANIQQQVVEADGLSERTGLDGVWKQCPANPLVDEGLDDGHAVGLAATKRHGYALDRFHVMAPITSGIAASRASHRLRHTPEGVISTTELTVIRYGGQGLFACCLSRGPGGGGLIQAQTARPRRLPHQQSVRLRIRANQLQCWERTI